MNDSGYYFYKPKYNLLYGPYDSVKERQEDFDTEGGVAVFYDYKPSDQEMRQAQDYCFWS